jgi:uncharacterized RDD family membrane protein YckC
MIDEQLHVRTPEGADLALPLAGPMPRAAAWLVDLVIRMVAYLFMALLFALLGGVGTGLMLIGIFLLEWFYPVFFEAFWHGQTPGKRTMKIAVVHANGTPLSFNGSLVRNLLRAADFFPFAYLTGLVAMMMSTRFQRLGDMAADTLVVHINDGARPDSSLRAGPGKALPDWPLTLADRKTLAGFAERANQLTEDRRRELAHHAFPELTPMQAEQRLARLAAQMLGDQ